MAPAEVLCQSGHLSLLRSCLDESDHVEKVLAAEAGPIFGRQLSRQRRDNLISVFRPGIAEDIAPYPAPNLPVEHHEFRVDGSRHTKPSCFDQATQVCGQLAENSRRWRWARRWSVSLICRPGLPSPVGLYDGGRPAADLRLCADQVEMSRLSLASLIPYEQFIVVGNRILL